MMNKLNQLGTLVMIFLACACQASSSEDQVSKAAENQSPTTTISNDEFNAEGEVVLISNTTNSTEPAEGATPKEEDDAPATQAVVEERKEESSGERDQGSPTEEKATSTEVETNQNPETEAVEEEEETIPNNETEPAEEEKVKETPSDATPPPPSHKIWNNLLTQYVSRAGNVQYKSLKESRMDELEQYLKELADNPVQKSWTKAQKMAYWMNAYNAFTVKLILDNYPISSITNLSGGKVWDKKWIKLGDMTYSLNNIENDILRPMYKDARIHFAVNCAAKSCPPLLNRAWTDVNLEYYLEGQAKRFINHPDYNQISADKVVISKIFEWYAEDFGNIIEYLNKYSKTKINADAKVSYQEYDWALNK